MMSKAIWTLGAGVMLFAATGMAAAFEPIDSPAGGDTASSNDANVEATQTAFRFAECQAKKHRTLVRDVLDAPNEDRAARARKALEQEDSCYLAVSVDRKAELLRVTMTDATYRGMLAEALLKSDDRAATLASLPVQPAYQRVWTALTGRPPSVDEMAICVADVDPSGIATMLATAPRSAEERQAVSGLNNAMGKCLQNGFQLQLDAFALRTAFAEALYHRAFDASPVATADASGAKGLSE